MLINLLSNDTFYIALIYITFNYVIYVTFIGSKWRLMIYQIQVEEEGNDNDIDTGSAMKYM
jgi:hypothetical protein